MIHLMNHLIHIGMVSDPPDYSNIPDVRQVNPTSPSVFRM